jgi:hypothetical protein
VVVLVQAAQAAILQNTIDHTASLTGHGRYALVTGPIACTAGDTLSIRVTLTQTTTGAQGQGRARLTCTGNLQTWAVKVSAFGVSAFKPGPAAACARASTSVQDRLTDERRWCAESGVRLLSDE